MKHFNLNAVMLAGALGLALNATAQEDAAPADNQPTQEEMMIPVPVVTDTTDTATEAVGAILNGGDAQPAEESAAHTGESFVKQGTTSPRYVAPMKNGTNGAPAMVQNSLSMKATPPDKVVKDGEKGLRLNFRNAPLDMVLSYLSDAAGFIIVPEADVKGKVDVWSNQPLTKDECIDLLNKVLAKEGFAVLRDGRTLTIVTQAEAKRRNETPVYSGTWDPAKMAKDQQIVTRIIPVRFIGAVQLAKDLQPLMASQTTMTANEGGNALVITDTQQNIHRLAEIITALDTTVSSLSNVKVFALRYADAKTVADMVKEVFTSTDTSRSGGGGGRGGRFQFGGGNPFAAMMGGGGDSGGGNSGRPGAAKVVATADERSNSLVVSAPDDLMPTIQQLVESIDTNVEDVTEIRVFRLKYADPQETTDLLASLFPDPTSSQNQRGGGGFGGFFRGGGFGGGNDTASSSTSDRMKKQTKVIAVPDKRTSSVVVTAARDTMEQISKMITQLDADPAHKKKVYIFDGGNTDPTELQTRLEELFSGQSTGSSRRTTTGQAGSQLNTRAQQQNQNGGTTRNNNSSFGGGSTSGTGGTRSFGN